jgi:hypothetical protein
MKFAVLQGLQARAQSSAAPSHTSEAMPPFHLAIPVNNLEEAKDFYGG